jgi:hypothetical protein
MLSGSLLIDGSCDVIPKTDFRLLAQDVTPEVYSALLTLRFEGHQQGSKYWCMSQDGS